MYVVTAYYNKYVRNKNDKNTYSELGRMLGCTYENVRDPTWDAYTTLMTPWMYASTGVITTEVRDGAIAVAVPPGALSASLEISVQQLPTNKVGPRLTQSEI